MNGLAYIFRHFKFLKSSSMRELFEQWKRTPFPILANPRYPPSV